MVGRLFQNQQTQNLKKILSYKSSSGLVQLPWMEEANGAWDNKDGLKIVYEKWLKTTFGYPSSDKPVFKVYLEGIREDTFKDYLKVVEKEISGKTNYNNAWYSLSWDESSNAEKTKESYIIFPNKNLGIYIIFYNRESLTKKDAEKIIQELVDHIDKIYEF